MVALLMLVACGDGVDNSALRAAHDANQPGEVTVQGTVVETLPDSSGSDGPHQRFTLNVEGFIVEVDNNLSLSTRVPLHAGDAVTLRGQFEPDPGHPVIHYTHHATDSHPGGWIDFNGRRYQ